MEKQITLQLISAYNTSDAPPYIQNTHSIYVLDNQNPYNDGDTQIPTGRTANVTLRDGPSFPGRDSIAVNMAYKDYLVFKPDAGSSIAVTLGRVEWSWLGGAWYDGSMWHTNSSCPAPEFYPDTAFPYYERVLHNGMPFE